MLSAGASAQTVTGRLLEDSVSRGSVVKGAIELAIPEGLHVNSNKPFSEYAIPTTVRISGIGFKPGGIIYPKGTNRKFQFSESELNVYEGDVSIPFTFFLPRRFRGGILRVEAVVTYQACTEEVCFSPKETTIFMSAKVR